MPNSYALLIGINCYQPNFLPDGSSYRNLKGCVRDINHVEDYLKGRLKLPPENIFKLIASENQANPTQPLEPTSQWPTYKNIVAKFEQLTDMAQPSDRLYIHYSGHGGRTKTLEEFKALKGSPFIDETIVPTDVGQPGGQYLRDLELAYLLKRMVDKELLVTIVLDSCNSGGATRGEDSDIRGMDVVDNRLEKSVVASVEELTEAWRSLSNQGTTRKLASSWLPESNNYVLVAACRPHELAYEYAFNRETKERNGALTYWMLDFLSQLRPGTSYKQLHDYVNAKIHSQFPSQTPMLIGQGDREVFGSDRTSVNYESITVMDVNLNRNLVLLEAGQMMGLRKGSEFALYPQATIEFKPEERLALAELVELGVSESWCELKALETSAEVRNVKQGDRAVLVAASTNLVRKVGLHYLEAAKDGENLYEKGIALRLPSQVYQLQEEKLQAVKRAMTDSGWLELAEDEEAAEYRVAINPDREYEICDRTGKPFENMQPALKIDDPEAATQVVKRLTHLAKYHATENLNNFDKRSPMKGRLVVEWIGKQTDYDPADRPNPKPFDDLNSPTVEPGEWVFLKIRNDYNMALNISVLNLSSDWSIEQIYPAEPGAKFVTLEPTQEEAIEIPVSLRGNQTHATDIAKVFATVGTPNFRWLELDALDKEELAPKGFTTRSDNPLENLLAHINDENPKTRKLNPAAFPSREWTVEQVRITVKKAEK